MYWVVVLQIDGEVVVGLVVVWVQGKFGWLVVCVVQFFDVVVDLDFQCYCYDVVWFDQVGQWQCVLFLVFIDEGCYVQVVCVLVLLQVVQVFVCVVFVGVGQGVGQGFDQIIQLVVGYVYVLGRVS